MRLIRQKYVLECKYMGLTGLFILLGSLLDNTEWFAGGMLLLGQVGHTLAQWGLMGMFLIAFFGSTPLVIQIPYTLPLLSAALHGTSLPNMVLLGLASGVGAALGKTLAYLLARKFFSQPQVFTHTRLFQWVKRIIHQESFWLPTLIFCFVATPLPDDVVIIPLATLHYDLKKLWLPLYAGKITHTVTVALIFYFFTDFSAQQLGGGFRTGLAGLLLLAFVMYLLYQAEKARLPMTTLYAG